MRLGTFFLLVYDDGVWRGKAGLWNLCDLEKGELLPVFSFHDREIATVQTRKSPILVECLNI